MRKNIIRILLAGAAVLAVSCEPDNPTVVPEKKPVITYKVVSTGAATRRAERRSAASRA